MERGANVDNRSQMNTVRSARPRQPWRSSFAALLLTCALAPAPAGAMSGPAPEASLSSRLAEIATPALRSASPAAQAARLSLAPSGPGSLLRDGNRVLVDVQLEVETAPALAALRQAGAEVVQPSARYRTVTVAARP